MDLLNVFTSFFFKEIKVVIITNLGQRHNMQKIQQIYQKLYRGLLYVVFHNLESQNAELVDVKKDLN